MFLFEHLGLVKALQFSITRKDGNQYYLVTSRPYGLLYQREISHLNVTTPPSTNPLPVSPNGRPYIWLDCDIERSACKSFNILNSLLEAQPRPVIKLTGGKQLMSLGGPRPERSWEDGGEKKIQEVELLLSEDELAHWCRYCHRLQIHGSRQVEFQRISGKGYSSEYGCVEVGCFLLQLGQLLTLEQFQSACMVLMVFGRSGPGPRLSHYILLYFRHYFLLSSGLVMLVFGAFPSVLLNCFIILQLLGDSSIYYFNRTLIRFFTCYS